MTHLATLVLPTIFQFATNLITAPFLFKTAGDLFLDLSTFAVQRHLALTWLTLALVTFRLASVISTGEHLVTGAAALELHSALDLCLCLAAIAMNSDGGLARRTSARMTKQRTVVGAVT